MTNLDNKPSLTRRVAVGAMWLVAGRWSMRFIGLISTILLARLLTPEDFGIVVLAGLVVGVLDALTDFRFGQALVHYQDASDDEYNTAWTFNLLRGLLVAAILAGGAWLFAAIFKEPRLIQVFWVLSLIALLDGVQNIGTIQFTKEMQFGRDFVLRLGHKLSSFVVCIALAILWQSYWALIGGMVAGCAVRLILSYSMHPYRPRLCVSAWRRIFSFSIWLMASEIITLINQRLEQFLIGAFMSPTYVGVYNVAYEISAMATTEVAGPAAQALFPGFSKIADNKQRLRDAYERSMQFIVAIGTPLGILLALVAPEFILIVLGSKWIDAETPMRVLSVMFSIAVLGMGSTSILPAMGRTRDVFAINATLLLARLPVTALIIWHFGFAGAAWARFVSAVWWLGHSMLMIRRALDVSFLRILRATWRSYGATAGMVGSVLSLGFLLRTPDTLQLSQLPISSLLFFLSAKVGIGLAAYISFHLLFWNIQGCPDGPENAIINTIKSRLRTSRNSK
jgi:lipopolysaccharide exporter